MTLTERLATYFKAWPNSWLSMQELARIAGTGGWRTRLSELRHPPFNMHIVNRQRTVNGYRQSDYKYEPPVVMGQQELRLSDDTSARA